MPESTELFPSLPFRRRTIVWIECHALVLTLALVTIATFRIAATWPVFSTTTDEPVHIACGLEWLDLHTYKLEDQHPPLARVAAAIGPYLLGIRSHHLENPTMEGAAILKDGGLGLVERNLIAARAGILPFFWISCGVVFIGARRMIGLAGAVLAVFLWSTLPPVLGQASLATTDMALTAMLGAAALIGFYWVENPTAARAALFGFASALAALSKFTSLPFLACGFGGMLIWHIVAAYPWVAKPSRRTWALLRRGLPSFVLAIAVAGVVIWAAYRFSYGPVRDTTVALPAPEFFSGVLAARQHNIDGHTAYLLGSISDTGFTQYYPVALGVKTPLPLLAFLVIGSGLCLWRWPRTPGPGYALAFSLGILIFAIVFSRINIGVRHILPVYLGFAVVAAYAVLEWLLKGRLMTALVATALMIWLVIDNVRAHPDYLAYFNETARREPERVLIDSDLDWGQDMKRLALRLQELKVPEFTYKALIFTELAEVDFPPVKPMDMEHPTPGWHAAHVTGLKLHQHDILIERPNARFWTNEIAPVERVGRGILLWHIEGAGGADTSAR